MEEGITKVQLNALFALVDLLGIDMYDLLDNIVEDASEPEDLTRNQAQVVLNCGNNMLKKKEGRQ